MVISTDDCWIYAGYKNHQGYGRRWIGNRTVTVHRLVWEDANSRVVPEGYHVDHLCRVKSCINPLHLEAVTPRENVLRGTAPPAVLARRTACKYGHTYTKATTRMQGNARRCRVCARNWIRDYRSRT